MCNYLPEITILNVGEVNIQEVAQVVLRADKTPSFYNPARNIESVVGELERRIENKESGIIITASKNDHIIGCVIVDYISPEMVRIGPWQPYVISPGTEDNTTDLLFQSTVGYAEEKGVKVLEVPVIGITTENEKSYRQLKTLYERYGLNEEYAELYMESSLSNYDLEEIITPEGISIKHARDVDDDELFNCYVECFKNSSDRFFEQKSEEYQRRSIHNRLQSSDFDHDASLVFLDHGTIIGFSFVRRKERPGLLGPFGILPDYRKQGLGESLLMLSMKSLVKQGHDKMYLEVDEENKPAADFYGKFGFITTFRSCVFRWRV
ncbi:MAG: GNAT family N-acetyltransferase [Candidatus Thorarchaeota archaeon]